MRKRKRTIRKKASIVDEIKKEVEKSGEVFSIMELYEKDEA